VALDVHEPLAHFGHQTWQAENGLPQNSVHAIAQTPDGYLWLGTEGGLVRFDGYSFTVFDSHNTAELKSNDIRYLLAASDHSLWVATAAGLVRIQASTFTRFDVREGLPSDNVWSVYETRSNGLWCVTADGLAHFDGARFVAFPMPSGIESLTGAIAEGENHSLWVGTHSGVRVFRKRRFARVPVQATLAGLAPAAILVDRGGHLWVGTENGLITLSELGTRTYLEKNGLPSRVITAVFEDKGGSIWVGTDAGLARITNGQVQRFPAGSPLAGSTVLSIADDREGDLWVGTDAGLTVLREQSFFTFDTRDGLPGEFVRAVFEGSDGALWIATDHGLSRRQHGLFSNLGTRNGLASDVTLSLAQDADGNLLVGTAAGLNTIHDRSISVLTSANGLPDDFVRSIYVDRDHSIWVSTRRGLSHLTGKAITTYTESDGLGSDFVGMVLRDRTGVLWAATLHGLSRLQKDRFRNYTTVDGLSSNIVTALYEDGAGTLWAGTQDGGLNRIRSSVIHAFAASLGLPQAIYGIAEDAAGNLWFSSNTGVYRAGKNALNRVAAGAESSVEVASFGTSDGLRISECSAGGHPSIWKAHDGGLWFATLKGVSVLDPDRVAENQTPPPVVLESVSIDDQTFNPATIDKIKPGHSRFAFEYAGLSFVSPTRVKYRYRLDGFDKHWIEAGTRRIAYYTNLGPGRYRFEVTAENGNGLWNAAGASLPFVLQPQFYQMYWFYTALVALVALLAYAVYRWRVREVEMRFAAVLGERNRIAREIHDTLAQGFVAVSVQLEVVARLLNSAPQAAQEHLDYTRSLVRSSIAEARRAIWELRSQSTEHDDFAARLSKIANRAASPGSVQVDFEVKGAYRPVMPAVEDELAKICQEAVINAVRHAHAERVSIELAFEKKRLRMTVTDNGCGFDVEPDASGPTGHFGLKGMRERAQRIDAKLVVDSETGRGTRVSVETMVN
jgi:ligand-binding sensor domain-containing protein/signal transduction histidine kinase